MLFYTAAPDAAPGQEADSLEGCIARMAAGDTDALAELYRRTHAAVYGLALSMVKNRADAEDILQDACLLVWQRAGSYRARGTPMAWLMTITRNLALDRLRERARTAELPPEDWQLEDDPALTQEDRLTLEALLELLSDEERQIVTLHAIAGLKHREISSLMRIPLPTVLSKYNRSMKKLKLAWKEAEVRDQ